MPAIYLGNIVSKLNFRVFVYSSNGSQKLVESWEEYERHMEQGLWFSTKEDAERRIEPAKIDEEKHRRTRKNTRLS